MTPLVKLALFVAPSVLLAVRPDNLQQLTKEKTSKPEVHTDPELRVNNGKMVIAVAPKNAFVELSTKGTHKKDQDKKEKPQHNHGQSSSSKNSTVDSTVVHTSQEGKKISTSSETKGSEGVDIASDWEDFLYQLIDEDGKDGIDRTEWDKVVIGGWADPMFTALDTEGGEGGKSDGKVDDAEFKKNWDPAVTAAFKAMGGDDDKITSDEVDTWQATEYEKSFAKDKTFMEDGHMDRAEFEEFIYTVILFRAIDRDGDGKMTWEEVQKNTKVNGKLGGQDAFPMAPMDLYNFLKKNNVFTVGPGSGSRQICASVAVVLLVAACPFLS